MTSKLLILKNYQIFIVFNIIGSSGKCVDGQAVFAKLKSPKGRDIIAGGEAQRNHRLVYPHPLSPNGVTVKQKRGCARVPDKA